MALVSALEVVATVRASSGKPYRGGVLLRVFARWLCIFHVGEPSEAAVLSLCLHADGDSKLATLFTLCISAERSPAAT